MPHYTRRGDDGTTGWLGKGRLPKNHPRIEAVGTLDEASAAMGAARSAARDRRTAPLLLEAQRDLYQLMAEASAAPEGANTFRFDPARVEWLEQQIDALAQEIPMPGEFIVPGDSAAGAALAVARAVVRRAERRVVELHRHGQLKNAALHQYLNRLSSLLFVLELAENKAAGKKTTLARPDNRGSAHER
ncbi:MAG: cob(I)yrinic acid a,c-diamide adenosyltransferase [Chloroflexota bacterium]